MINVDGVQAVAKIAHQTNEVICIYPITPASTIGEYADEYSANGHKNIWGNVPDVIEMQSEAGAIGSVHGALQTGSLSTTFTSSQGLLLMIPNLYKIAGELTSFCMHVSARTIATNSLSIFGDHSDVMACRQTGMALLASSSVQETQDFAAIGQAAALSSRVPFIHFHDGFRTSHEISKIEALSEDDLRFMLNDEDIKAHRERALTPDNPFVRGTAANPDTFFQTQEARNLFYNQCPELVQKEFDKFAQRTGRQYQLFEYLGDPNAERVIVVIGSGAQVCDFTAEKLNRHSDEKVGVVNVRLYRPFSVKDFLSSIPKTVQSIAVLDRTKEAGSIGEPLYLDVITAIHEARDEGTLHFENQYPKIIGGRFGLSSKDFTPQMVKAVYDELAKEKSKNHFTVGINDDITHTSLTIDNKFNIESDRIFTALFYGLGSDGTVGANKNTIKIIGEETDNYVQGYFVYDSKKAGAVTISHLRFGPRPIRSSYLVQKAKFVGCHNFNFLNTLEVLEKADQNAVFLLNSFYDHDKVWDKLSQEIQQQIIDKNLTFYHINAYEVAHKTGMGHHINTIMQTCFFAISGVLPSDIAIDKIKNAIKKTYSKKGEAIVQHNFEAVDGALAHLQEIDYPKNVTSKVAKPPIVPDDAPDFVKQVTAIMLSGQGDKLPVSAFPVDGTWESSTTKWERRNIALEIPIWDSDICIQCNKCAYICPHAAIRAKVYPQDSLDHKPESFKSLAYKAADFKGDGFTIQVAPEDCTGCTLCVQVCPAVDKTNPDRKAINMKDHLEHLEVEKENWSFFSGLPRTSASQITKMDLKSSQLMKPLFEFSGACEGCGETSYIKLLTQLYGDHLYIANATGCSSIYGGNMPTTPYSKNEDGYGPAWSNSLFEDNAEFGLGYRLSLNANIKHAVQLLTALKPQLNQDNTQKLLDMIVEKNACLEAQRKCVAALRVELANINTPEARRLETIANYLTKKTIWTIGGDGWAYDIGYGGIDHVLSLTENTNILVLDTECYSNTGGQQSKSTPLGAVAKFAANGKGGYKKDLGAIAMSYGHIYVAAICIGANDMQTIKAIQEAESYDGPSIVLAYSPCIAHGYDLSNSLAQQKSIVDSGLWPLYRYDPRRVSEGKNPLQIDTKKIKTTVSAFMANEARFKQIEKRDSKRYKVFTEKLQAHSEKKLDHLKQLSKIEVNKE